MAMTTLTFAEASRRALAAEMRADPRVWVLGEDVRQGGVFGQYAGLVAEFGPDRVVDTPIAEATIMGAGLGAALVGTRPVIEMRIADFVMPAMDELVNQIAKARYMFGGQARASLVIRMPHGLLPGSAAQHSQTIENWFVNIPGLVVLAPATAADLAGLLRSAIRCDDPVAIFEPKAWLKRQAEVPDDVPPVEIGKAAIAREGSDVTLVAWSQAVAPSLAGAQAAASHGVSTEVIDLRSLWPWDRASIIRSLEKTRRLLVVQEGGMDGGFGNDILASMIEHFGLSGLKAARRMGAPRIPVPFSTPMEHMVELQPTAIEARLRALMAEGG